jgi:hypothetical protein
MTALFRCCRCRLRVCAPAPNQHVAYFEPTGFVRALHKTVLHGKIVEPRNKLNETRPSAQLLTRKLCLRAGLGTAS